MGESHVMRLHLAVSLMLLSLLLISAEARCGDNTSCHDGLDNNDDGRIDCADEACIRICAEE